MTIEEFETFESSESFESFNIEPEVEPLNRD